MDHLNHTKSYLRGGRMTKDTNGYLVLWILPSPTYKVEGWPRISMSTWFCEYYQVLPMGWTDDQGYWQVLGLTNFIESYLRGRRMTKDTDEYLVLEFY